MELASILAEAVSIAKSLTLEGWEQVDWTFTISGTVDFDPEEDSMSGETETKKIWVLLYTEENNDTGTSFSSVGRFNDQPIERATSNFMLEAAECAPRRPTVDDFFVTAAGVKYIVRSVEQIPTDPAFIGKCSI